MATLRLCSSDKVLALLACVLVAGCAKPPPPMPDGAVPVPGGSVDLGPVAGHASQVSATTQDLAQLGVRWVDAEPSDARLLALARSELLRTPPGTEAALQWLDEVQAPTCDHHRTRAIAQLVESLLGPALEAIRDCNSPADRTLRERALTVFGVRQPTAPLSRAEPRTLYRAAARELSTSLDMGAPSDQLVALSAAHARAFDVEGAARWWDDALASEPPPDWREALSELAAFRPPRTLALGRESAALLSGLALRLVGHAGDLPAARAAHLSAYYADRAGDPDPARWVALEEMARGRWPYLETISLIRRATLLTERGPDEANQALSLLERAGELARRHHLVDQESTITRAVWDIDRRPALAGAEARVMLALLELEPVEDHRVLTLNRLGFTAWRAGWPELARAACAEALADTARVCRAAPCDDLLTLLTPLSNRPARIRGLLERRSGCGDDEHLVFRHAELAEALHRTGERQAALTELAKAKALLVPTDPEWGLFVQGMRLLLADELEPALDRFDAIARSHAGDGAVDHRGWVTERYRDLVHQRAIEDASTVELWALLGRREAVRTGARSPTTIPQAAEPLAFLPSEDDGLLVLSRTSAALRRTDRLPETLLDLASTEAATWIATGNMGPTQQWLSEQLALEESDGLLLQVGSASELGPPLATLPAVDRPTAQWIPRQTSALTWTTGVVLSGSNKGGADLYGVHELTVAMGRSGWTSGHADSTSELSKLIENQPVVHITAHGSRVGRSRVALVLGPELLLDAATLRTLPLMPGSLVTLAACEAGGGTGGDLPLDLPFAAFQAGAAAVIYSRYPVRSVPLHKATERLYRRLPFPCAELPARWHQIRKDYGRQLLGVEIGVSASCLAHTE